MKHLVAAIMCLMLGPVSSLLPFDDAAFDQRVSGAKTVENTPPYDSEISPNSQSPEGARVPLLRGKFFVKSALAVKLSKSHLSSLTFPPFRPHFVFSSHQDLFRHQMTLRI